MIFNKYDEDELKKITIKNLAIAENLDRLPWNFLRGAKTERFYKNQEGDLEIRPYYVYNWKNDDDGLQREIYNYEQFVDFLNPEIGEVFLTNSVPNSFNKKNVKEINRAMRVGRVDHLITAAEDLEDAYNALPSQVDEATVQYLISINVAPPMFVSDVITYHAFRDGLLAISEGIEALLNHYSIEITNYKEYGHRSFENAINSETIPAFIRLLNTPARPADSQFPNGLTVKQSILYQLTGVKP